MYTVNDLVNIVTDMAPKFPLPNSALSGGGQPCVNDKLSIYRFQRSSWEKEDAMLISVHIP
jgi:hypothetical protein